jgi:uncharacterized protein YfaS (alpha-2-macroglobulin family)/uncharacterized protein YhhL (DUF1145 family)
MSENDTRELKRVEELTFKLLDDDLDAAEGEELERLLADPEAERLHLALMEQEAALRGARAGFDLADTALERVRRVRSERVERGVMEQLRAGRGLRGLSSWLWGLRFWGAAGAAAAVALVLALVPVVKHRSASAEPQEAYLYGQASLTPGLPGAYRVLVRDGKDRRPVEGARVRLAIYRPDGQEVWRQGARTDSRGMASVRPQLPVDAADGSYKVRLVASSGLGESTLWRQLDVRRSSRVYVTTDKPLYQPGQRIRVRALSLASADLRPVAGRELVLEVRDAKQNKVFKRRLRTSRFGVAWADFQLADEVNLGRYTISATVGDTSSERHVTVRRYRLPRFRVKLETDRAFYTPGQVVEGALEARYTFGPAVAGARVEVAAEELIHEPRVFARLEGVTDSQGRMRFRLGLKEHFVGQSTRKGDAPVTLRAKVVDAAEHTVTATRDLTVTAAPIRVEVFPESGKLVRGVPNRLYVVTAYPDGRPARAAVTVKYQGATHSVAVDGVAVLEVKPGGTNTRIEVTARDAAGLETRVSRSLEIDWRAEALLLRPDRAIYRGGDAARVQVLAPGYTGTVFVDVIKDRRTALVRSVEVEGGRGALALDLPPDLFGTLSLHAYRILPNGELLGDTRLIQVNRADQLSVTAELDRAQYRPAQRATLRVAVHRRDGTPVQAALGLCGVDEAVFALAEARPGLVQVFFALQRELLEPRHELHGVQGALLDPTAAVTGAPVPARGQLAGQALFAAAAERPPLPRTTSGRYEDRVYQLRRETERRLHEAAAVGAVGVLVLIGGILLPLLIAGTRRMWRRAPLPGDPALLQQLERAIRRLSLWWAGGLFLPTLGALAAAIVVRHGAGAVLVVALGGGLALLSLVMQVIWIRRLRGNELSHRAPVLRRLLTGLPAAYLMIWGFLVLLGLAQDYPRGLPELVGVALVLVLLLCAALLIGVLPATARSLARPTTAAQWLKAASWRFLLAVVLPTVGVFFVLMFATFGGAPMVARDMVGQAKLAASAPDVSRASTGEAGKKAATPARVRRHFPETLIWRPQIITDETGRASVEIPLADSVTTWRLSLSAVSAAGELGASTTPLRVFQDFFVDLDLPVSLTQNDRVQVPVAVYNHRDQDQTVRLTLSPAPWYRLEGRRAATVRVRARQAGVAHFTLVALRPGEHKLQVRASAGRVADAVERAVRVEPDGERVVRTFSGRLQDQGVGHELVFPAEAIAGASKLLVKVYPGTFSQLVEGLDAVFQMPYGCFEQTSSATYPNVLALSYLKRTGRVRPEIELKARSYINQGYQRLLTFEVPGGGFEWFGHAPAHTVLTAYGLLELSDMSLVHAVDPAVISRTRSWLLSRQESDGSWAPPSGGIAEGAINRQQGQQLRTTAYIAWAALQLSAPPARPTGLQSRRRDERPDPRLGRALDHIERHLRAENDPYTLALCASALASGGRVDSARRVLARLDRVKQLAEGGGVFWRSKTQGVTFSGGDVLAIETTALVAHALLEVSQSPSTAHAALGWLVSQKDARGTWHSTQATVLALRALLRGTEAERIEGTERVVVKLNGRAVRTVTITQDTADLYHQIDLSGSLRAGGANVVRLERLGAGAGRPRRPSRPAYQVVATHYMPRSAEQPAKPGQPLTIEQRYDSTRLKQNDRLGARVTLRYNHPGRVDMLIVDLGVPAGFAIEPGTFEALVQHKVIERYTVAGAQVTLYIRGMTSDQPLSFVYHLRARYPVRVSAPPARTYQYYDPGVRDETRPVKLTVL